MECLPGWGISSLPGPPQRQHEHERRYTQFTPPFILIKWIWNDDYDGQMILGDPWGPKAPWHLSNRWGKTPKKLLLGNLSRPGSNPGPLRERRACYGLLQSGGVCIKSYEQIMNWKTDDVFCFINRRYCFLGDRSPDYIRVTYILKVSIFFIHI